MTAIASWIDRGGKVWIGGDSGASDDSTIYSRKDKKVFKKGPFLIGGSGSYRCIQLVKYSGSKPGFSLSNLRPPKSKARMHEFMVCKFVPVVRSLFLEGGLTSIEDGVESFEGDLIVGVNGMIFGIDSDFQVGMYEKYASIGSGCHFCLGSLYSAFVDDELSFDEDKDGEEILRVSLSAAAEHSPYVKEPFDILSE